MPIKNKSRYPKNWEEISPAARECAEMDDYVCRLLVNAESLKQPLLPVLLEYKDALTDSTYWAVLRAVWIKEGHDNPVYRQLFYSDRKRPHKVMKSSDRRALRKLPQEFPIYRANRDTVVDPYAAFNWTTDYETARQFALRYKSKIISRRICKEDVLAFFNSRQESEVILKEKALAVSFRICRENMQKLWGVRGWGNAAGDLGMFCICCFSLNNPNKWDRFCEGDTIVILDRMAYGVKTADFCWRF